MRSSLNRELFKARHQHLLWYSLLALFVLMLYATFPLAYLTRRTVAQGFGLDQWVIILMIAISSNTVTMEYRDHTMPTLLYKSPHKIVPYIAKLVILFIEGLVMLAVGIIFTLIIQSLFARRFAWSTLLNHHSLFINLFASVGGGVVYLLFTITLSLLLVAISGSNAVVIVIGLAIGFFGSNLSAALMQALPGLKAIIAWNPLNMINIINPFANAASTVYLSTSQLVIGNLIYSALFLAIGLLIFKRARI